MITSPHSDTHARSHGPGLCPWTFPRPRRRSLLGLHRTDPTAMPDVRPKYTHRSSAGRQAAQDSSGVTLHHSVPDPRLSQAGDGTAQWPPGCPAVSAGHPGNHFCTSPSKGRVSARSCRGAHQASDSHASFVPGPETKPQPPRGAMSRAAS